MRALLDVGVLTTLFDFKHIHRNSVSEWFVEHARRGWATCPLTQNGCIRMLSQATYSNQAPAALGAEIFTEATADPRHEFWPDSSSVLTSDVLH